MTTPAEVRALLDPEEVQYAPIAARLGPDDLPAVRELAAGENLLLASKAVYLASLIEGGDDVVSAAADSGDPVLRAAAASAVVNLSGDARTQVAATLLDTSDVAVQKITLRNLGPKLPDALSGRVRELADSDQPTVRDLAAERLDN